MHIIRLEFPDISTIPNYQSTVDSAVSSVEEEMSKAGLVRGKDYLIFVNSSWHGYTLFETLSDNKKSCSCQ